MHDDFQQPIEIENLTRKTELSKDSCLYKTYGEACHVLYPKGSYWTTTTELRHAFPDGSDARLLSFLLAWGSTHGAGLNDGWFYAMRHTVEKYAEIGRSQQQTSLNRLERTYRVIETRMNGTKREIRINVKRLVKLILNKQQEAILGSSRLMEDDEDTPPSLRNGKPKKEVFIRSRSPDKKKMSKPTYETLPFKGTGNRSSKDRKSVV